MTIKPFISQQAEMTPSVQHDDVLQNGIEQLSMMPDVMDENSEIEEELHHYNSSHDYDLRSPPNSGIDHRGAHETEVQYKERILNHRAAQLFAVMKPKLSAGQELSFTEVAPRHNTRKEVAQKFYSLLLLKNQQVLKIEQNESDVPVTICKGSRFESEAI